MDRVAYDGLKACLLRAEGDLSTSTIVSQLSEIFASGAEAESTLDALIGASLFAYSTDVGLEDAAKELTDSEILELGASERELLRSRFVELFRTPVLELFAKAVSLRAEEERSYCKSRILTDLRPIFSGDDSAEPIAALIKHTLKFDVHEDGDIRSISISIDTRGLSELVTAIARAAQKATSLAAIAHSSNLQLIDFEEPS